MRRSPRERSAWIHAVRDMTRRPLRWHASSVKKYIHFEHCSDWVDAEVWCNTCLQENTSQLGLCQKCHENYFRHENAYQAMDGQQVICKKCFEEQQKEQGTADTEEIDDRVVDSEAVEARSVGKGRHLVHYAKS